MTSHKLISEIIIIIYGIGGIKELLKLKCILVKNYYWHLIAIRECDIGSFISLF